jgi:hypothetical protein
MRGKGAVLPGPNLDIPGTCKMKFGFERVRPKGV